MTDSEEMQALSDADDVLSELKELGALGSPEKPKVPAPRVEEMEVEGAEPGPALRDARGSQMVELLDTAMVKLGRAVDALEGLQETLGALRDVWAGDLAEAAPEAPAEALEEDPEAETAEAPEAAEEPAQGFSLETPDKVAATAEPVPTDEPERPAELPETKPNVNPESEEYRLAREAALRKVRGEDLSEEEQRRLEELEAQRAQAEDDEDIPYVGQATVKPDSNGESTVGTLGTIKPSFPVDDGGNSA